LGRIEDILGSVAVCVEEREWEEEERGSLDRASAVGSWNTFWEDCMIGCCMDEDMECGGLSMFPLVLGKDCGESGGIPLLFIKGMGLGLGPEEGGGIMFDWDGGGRFCRDEKDMGSLRLLGGLEEGGCIC